MKVCVTGGAGFIGSHLVDALLKENHEVAVIDNLSTGFLSNLKDSIDKINFYEGDINDHDLMLKALEDVEIVFHQAALTSVTRSMKNPLETHKQTMTGSVNVLDCSRQMGVKRFIYATSSSVYGNQSENIKSESMPMQPLSPYAAAKASFEMYASSYSRSFELTTIGLRYFNVFGPRQDPASEYAAVIPLFIKMMQRNEPPTITGDGNQSRDFTYVDNVVHANLLAMKCENIPKGCVVNTACGFSVTLPDLVDSLNKVAKTNFIPKYVPFRPGDVRHSLADISQAKKILGYSPTVPFEQGLKKHGTMLISIGKNEIITIAS